MATNEKNNVIVELYDLSISERKDDRFGRVVTIKSLNEDDLINIAVSERTDLNPNSLRSSMQILKEIAKKQLVNGASVAFGLGYFNLGVNGIFIGDKAQWDSTQHSLSIRVTPTAELRETVKNATVETRGMAAIGTYINRIEDILSKTENSRLTPGGPVNILGDKIRIIGDNPENGIKLINQATQEVTSIKADVTSTNDPSKVSFVVPANLAVGDYRLGITTQYCNSSTLLNQPRTYLSEYILTV
ncbi:MAG: DUF4469 domain-containing protein [Paludibacter sp.]|nr:DUF4469 domain-containing protein [Paludibacter sp.]